MQASILEMFQFQGPGRDERGISVVWNNGEEEEDCLYCWCDVHIFHPVLYSCILASVFFTGNTYKCYYFICGISSDNQDYR